MNFKGGEKVYAISLQNGDTITEGVNCDSIIVSLEPGQFGLVPWFVVFHNGKMVSKWNSIFCGGVFFNE